jgi:hypothetical protein
VTQVGWIDEKPEGRKSRETVPLMWQPSIQLQFMDGEPETGIVPTKGSGIPQKH